MQILISRVFFSQMVIAWQYTMYIIFSLLLLPHKISVLSVPVDRTEHPSISEKTMGYVLCRKENKDIVRKGKP